MAGRRDRRDPRNSLFMEFVRIVDGLKPKFFVMENVPGILTMQDGKVYQEIIRQFKEIGYPDMSVRILDAATYGIPQLRTRAVFIANRIGLKNPYPAKQLSKKDYKSIDSAIDDSFLTLIRPTAAVDGFPCKVNEGLDSFELLFGFRTVR